MTVALVVCVGCGGGRWNDRPCEACGWKVDRISDPHEDDEPEFGEPVTPPPKWTPYAPLPELPA